MTLPLAILDIGAVTPLGRDWRSTWDGLLAGRASLLSTSDLGFVINPPVPVGAIADLDREVDVHGHGPAARLIRAAVDLVELPDDLGPPRIWAGSNHGEAGLLSKAPARSRDPLPDLAIDSPCTWISSACTTGLHTLYFCFLEGRYRTGVWMSVAGDALSDIGVAGFARSGATGRGLPQPLREESPGMLVSEGAIALGLGNCEVLDHPSVLGMGLTSDADHPTHPDPSGRYLELAVRNALQAAKVAAEDVVAVVAHGTGTTANDEPEAAMIARVFGPRPAVTSPKGSVGHVMGAAGLLGVAIGTEIWRRGLVPPTAGNSTARAGLRVSGEVVTVEKRRPVLVLASGFGGNNVAAVLG